jgi:hypothetical protein
MYEEDRKAIIPCEHCGQWGAVYTPCGKCGAPIQRTPPDSNESPLIACDYCYQFGTARTECEHCGAPMPDSIIHISGRHYAGEPTVSYFAEGGVSMSSWWSD